MDNFCSACGFQNSNDSKFCQGCGGSLTDPIPVNRSQPVYQSTSNSPVGRATYTIEGHEMQFVEIELDTGESIIAEAGAMMYMEQGIQMETIFGDDSGKEGNDFIGKIFSANGF